MYTRITTASDTLLATSSSIPALDSSSTAPTSLTHAHQSGAHVTSRDFNTPLDKNAIERGFLKELSNAEAYIQLFIRTYVFVWTLQSDAEGLSLQDIYSRLPHARWLLEHGTDLTKDQRLNLILKCITRMKSVLPNTIQQDRRQEQLHNPLETMDILSKLDASTGILGHLLQILGESSKVTDISDLLTSDINSPSTVLAAAYLIKEQLSKLRN